MEASLLEVCKPCQATELQSYLGLNPICKHPNFSVCTAKVWLAIPREFAIPNPHILSCISFEIQMLDNLEITFEEENILRCICPCQTGLMTKALHIYRLEEAVSRIVSYVCKIN